MRADVAQGEGRATLSAAEDDGFSEQNPAQHRARPDLAREPG
jgi:hypothetical protein